MLVYQRVPPFVDAGSSEKENPVPCSISCGSLFQVDVCSSKQTLSGPEIQGVENIPFCGRCWVWWTSQKKKTALICFRDIHLLDFGVLGGFPGWSMKPNMPDIHPAVAAIWSCEICCICLNSEGVELNCQELNRGRGKSCTRWNHVTSGCSASRFFSTLGRWI